MTNRPLPHNLKTALGLLEADPARDWSIGRLAEACNVAPRTLQKHFGTFLGSSPVQFIRNFRLDHARQELLRAPPTATVTQVATRFGFNHLGRFSTRYSERYGESPSATLRRRREISATSCSPPPLPVRLAGRPAVAVLPFNSIGLAGPGSRGAGEIAEEVAAALWRLRWLTVTSPAAAPYHVRGKIRSDDSGRLRLSVVLVEAHSGRCLWADHFDGQLADIFEFEDRVAIRVALAIQPCLRGAEIDRACRKDRGRLDAWELTMRALPCALSFEPVAEALALELLEEAIDLAPQDPLPLALASWCHGLRAGHHFTPHAEQERNAARSLAARAAQLNASDSLTETLLASGYTLAHDLASAAVHVDRALMFDGGSAWAWGRSGWIKAYGGEYAEAIEQFHIARTLAPGDPLDFLWAIGLGSAHLESAQYDKAIQWYKRAIVERPTALWNDRFVAAAYALAGRKDEAQQTAKRFARNYPDVTIAHVRAGLPHSALFLDRIAEGLETAGLR